MHGPYWMKSTRLLAPAETELFVAVEYYERKRSGTGRCLLDAVESVVGGIGQFPGMGGMIAGGFRGVLVPGFPCVVVYQERPDECLIVAVAHTSRRSGYWRERIN